MEEELNENDLEDRLYAMLHHVDETQANVVEHSSQNEPPRVVEAGSMRRYWREPPPPQRYNTAFQKVNNPLHKVNTPKEPINKPTRPLNDKNKPKEEQLSPQEPSHTVDLSVLLSTPPQNLHKSIEILDHDEQVLELDSSDEDEVIEVALPPKPTITIESSDEEELQPKTVPTTKENHKITPEKVSGDRDVSSSPVPSIVSSVSDDFIRGDCIALNISSRHSDNHSFDFGLHGSDLLGQDTPAKKRKRKRNKETGTTPITVSSTPIKPQEKNQKDECFATPRSKSRSKRQKKTYLVNEKSIPNPDIYDSDSNHSMLDSNSKKQSYTVTEKSLPSADVYESDSSQPESINSVSRPKQLINTNSNNNNGDSTNITSFETEKQITNTLPTSKRIEPDRVQKEKIIDLTENSDCITINDSTLNDTIEENLVMANVTGFEECHDYDDTFEHSKTDKGKFGSTKIPAILNEDLDFDNMKGINRVCSKRRYSLTTLRAEMEKFYNESWGGEDFNHREIQKNMSRDKSLWVIDPKDRMPSLSKRKVTCNYCNRVGHREDKCRARPPVCYMCGSTGHYEPRCPAKICVNCGSPNQMYSTMCRNCCSWGRITCAECGQGGHPSSHCPDLWRRYHNTVDFTTPLVDNNMTKKYQQLSCSGCTRRGHLIHNCRSTIPFSGLPINSPYVFSYNPMFFPQYYDQRFQQRQPIQEYNSYAIGHKRQSKSPIAHDPHKKRNVSTSDVELAPKSPNVNRAQRKISGSKSFEESKGKETNNVTEVIVPEDPNKLPDFIPIGSSNHDKKGQMIQDNEVSDTSEAVTSARIYVTNEIIDKLKQDEGQEWLKKTSEKLDITVQTTDVNSFICIKGKVGDQEAFQAELREWTRINVDKANNHNDTIHDPDQSQFSENIPKNRSNLLRKITKALASLKEDIGDPKAIYKELTYLQNRHVQLLNCKVVSPKQLSNNRNNMNIAHKKLNMVLLGQAGLADGSQHVHELTSLHEKLCNLRQKHIPTDVREEVGHHYHSIFSASPRDDYNELVNKYYVSNQRQNTFKRKKKDKLANMSPKRVQKIFNTIPSPVKNPFAERNAEDHKQIQVNKTMGKLSFFHRRLLRTKPMDIILKKTRMELVRKLHTQIACLSNATGLSSKIMKKTKKIQEQARRFLQNV